MKTKREASALYLVVFTTAIIAFSLGSWWYRSSLHIDIAATREIYYKHYYATEIILEYGIELIRENKNTFFESEMQNKTPITLPLSFLFHDTMMQNYDANLVVISKKNAPHSIRLIAALSKEKKSFFSQGCFLEKVRRGDDLYLVERGRSILFKSTC
jgi:hypothetical protein